MVKAFVPDAGDLVWLDFDPAAGREQAGRRPALILSPARYNGKTGLAIAAPITSHRKGYPFEVALPAGGSIAGVVLSDHLKNIDWKYRRAEYAGACPPAVLRDVEERVRLLLGFDAAAR